jgi:hypothetical protein
VYWFPVRNAPKIHIQGTGIEYGAGDPIVFDEGSIGLPRLRLLVIVSKLELYPFL